MDIRLIRTEADYEAAMAEYEAFFDDEPGLGTEAADRFEVLGMLLAKHEETYDPMPAAAPLEVLKFKMQQTGRTQRELAELLGSRSRASEILRGRRSLTLDQIRLLSARWHIPAAALIGEPEAA